MIVVQNATELATFFLQAAQQLRDAGDLSAAELADTLYARAMALAATIHHPATRRTEELYDPNIAMFGWEG